ncbi:MAG: aldo/keto reductase [Verrucomicrobia bacterium]|nr:MAG: aldo/keto reductase [Verrucomicrobiota bacterium]
MDYKVLGRTGLRVSRIALGTMNFGDSVDEQQGIRLLDRAVDAGVNFIDTADVYWKGRSEEIVGKAIKGKRDPLVIATKCWAPFGDKPTEFGSTRFHIMNAAESALKRLGIDHIDLFIMHRPDSVHPDLKDNETPTEETLRALTDLVRQGKVRYIGTSCYNDWRLVEAQLTSRLYNLEQYCSDQLNYSILNRFSEKQVLKVARRYGIGITVFSPLQYGWLSGKYHRGQEPPTDSRAARNFKMRLDSPDADANFTALEKLEPLAGKLDLPLARLALAWVLRNPDITSVICGPRTMEQLDDNLASLEVRLDDETMSAVDEIIPSGFGAGQDYA